MSMVYFYCLQGVGAEDIMDNESPGNFDAFSIFQQFSSRRLLN